MSVLKSILKSADMCRWDHKVRDYLESVGSTNHIDRSSLSGKMPEGELEILGKESAAEITKEKSFKESVSELETVFSGEFETGKRTEVKEAFELVERSVGDANNTQVRLKEKENLDLTCTSGDSSGMKCEGGAYGREESVEKTGGDEEGSEAATHKEVESGPTLAGLMPGATANSESELLNQKMCENSSVTVREDRAVGSGTTSPQNTGNPSDISPLETAVSESTSPQNTGNPSDISPLETAVSESTSPQNTGNPSDISPLQTAVSESTSPQNTRNPSDISPLQTALSESTSPQNTGNPNDISPLEIALSESTSLQNTGNPSDISPLETTLSESTLPQNTGNLSDISPLQTALSESTSLQNTGNPNDGSTAQSAPSECLNPVKDIQAERKLASALRLACKALPWQRILELASPSVTSLQLMRSLPSKESNLGSLMRGLVNLRELDLSGNQLGPQGFRVICLAVSRNSSLRSLNLANNQGDTDSSVSMAL